MTIKYLKCCALLFLVCVLIVLVPVSAATTTEQSISDSLTRGSRFTVSLTGLPNTSYYIWLPGTFTMTGKPGDQPPYIADNTENVMKDPAGGPYTIGSYQYNNGGGRTIRDDVAASTPDMPNTNYYALVTTDASGQAIVQFQTSTNTALRSYSVKAENPQSVEGDNLLIEETLYTRKAPGPMIITPTEILVTQTTTPLPIPVPTTVPEISSQVPTTPLPATTLPRHASLETGIALVSVFAGLILLRRR
ncbi:hypothetical protein [Methanoregula sp.]|jgi:hypothetical protein|uniref:hypothetical protein n=1 Tax=Methanoregula sp. TaxID=2052170 RepID=UPI003C14D9F7